MMMSKRMATRQTSLCLLITLTITTLTFGEELESKNCHPRNFGYDSVVCVCSQEHKCEDIQWRFSAKPDYISSYVTDKNGARFEYEEYHFVSQSSILNNNKTNDTSTPIVVSIDRGKTFQTIIGFGGAFTDSFGINIGKLSSTLQDRLIADYYSPGGIEYTMGRVPIGGCDFSPRPYTYADNGTDDSLDLFALQPEDFQYKLPYIHKASSVSEHKINLFGSTWSPPAWMKTNNQINHGGFLKGAPGGKYYKLFAQYLVRFLQEYAKQNVTLWGLTVENEPQQGWKSNYSFNSLGFNGTLERDFVKLDLGPALKEANFSVDKDDEDGLRLMIFDDNLDALDGLSNIAQFAKEVLSDKVAANYTSGVAFHWYGTTARARPLLDLVAIKFRNHFLLSTEASEIWRGHSPPVSLGDWSLFERYTRDIMLDLYQSVVGWIDWNLAVNTDGGPNWAGEFCNAAIVVNETAAEYYKQPIYYAIGHFSKFIPPNSTLIRQIGIMNSFDDKLLALPFVRMDGKIVLTIYNENDFTVPIEIDYPSRGVAQIVLRANSLQTLIWES